MRGRVAEMESWKGDMGVHAMPGSKYKQLEKPKEERPAYSILGQARPARLVAYIPWLMSITSLPHRSNTV